MIEGVTGYGRKRPTHPTLNGWLQSWLDAATLLVLLSLHFYNELYHPTLSHSLNIAWKHACDLPANLLIDYPYPWFDLTGFRRDKPKVTDSTQPPQEIRMLFRDVHLHPSTQSTIRSVLLLLYTQLVLAEMLSIPTITVQPAMFGKRWNSMVTGILEEIKFDLCDESSAWTAKKNTNGSTNTNTNTNTSTSTSTNISDFKNPGDGFVLERILFFHDFHGEGDGKVCEYVQMAHTVERVFPTAKYLLITRSEFSTLGIPEDFRHLDTKLSLATLSMEDYDRKCNTTNRENKGSIHMSLKANASLSPFSFVCFVERNHSKD